MLKEAREGGIFAHCCSHRPTDRLPAPIETEPAPSPSSASTLALWVGCQTGMEKEGEAKVLAGGGDGCWRLDIAGSPPVLFFNRIPPPNGGEEGVG